MASNILPQLTKRVDIQKGMIILKLYSYEATVIARALDAAEDSILGGDMFNDELNLALIRALTGLFEAAAIASIYQECATMPGAKDAQEILHKYFLRASGHNIGGENFDGQKLDTDHGGGPAAGAE